MKPDLISIDELDNKKIFFIFDAKYYNIQLERGSPLDRQPGIESIIKQYLYQLAFKDFIELHKFDDVKNCFLFPIDSCEVENRGFAQLKILNNQDLENIQTIFLPAKIVFKHYLEDKPMAISKLKIN